MPPLHRSRWAWRNYCLSYQWNNSFRPEGWDTVKQSIINLKPFQHSLVYSVISFVTLTVYFFYFKFHVIINKEKPQSTAAGAHTCNSTHTQLSPNSQNLFENIISRGAEGSQHQFLNWISSNNKLFDKFILESHLTGGGGAVWDLDVFFLDLS